MVAGIAAADSQVATIDATTGSIVPYSTVPASTAIIHHTQTFDAAPRVPVVAPQATGYVNPYAYGYNNLGYSGLYNQGLVNPYAAAPYAASPYAASPYVANPYAVNPYVANPYAAINPYVANPYAAVNPYVANPYAFASGYPYVTSAVIEPASNTASDESKTAIVENWKKTEEKIRVSYHEVDPIRKKSIEPLNHFEVFAM